MWNFVLSLYLLLLFWCQKKLIIFILLIIIHKNYNHHNYRRKDSWRSVPTQLLPSDMFPKKLSDNFALFEANNFGRLYRKNINESLYRATGFGTIAIHSTQYFDTFRSFSTTAIHVLGSIAFQMKIHDLKMTVIMSVRRLTAIRDYWRETSPWHGNHTSWRRKTRNPLFMYFRILFETHKVMKTSI